ncbi:MAG: hypothetical protein V3V49_09790 [Candidatus Krumholzibacteria bacterium]
MKRRAMALLLFVLVVWWSEGTPQIIITENHYKVYEVPEAFKVVAPITLVDQFDIFKTDSVVLDKFATPVDKNGSGIFDPTLHQTWWEIFQPQPGRDVLLDNQFGTQTWHVMDARYLVLPALKDEFGPPPVWNHYKCYDAVGPPVNIPVTLIDQFGVVNAIAVEPVLFCNPVEKTVAGETSPIIDPAVHLACYRLEPPQPSGFSAMAFDQFSAWPLMLIDHVWLCLPTEKRLFVPIEEGTWGKIKSLYRG